MRNASEVVGRHNSILKMQKIEKFTLSFEIDSKLQKINGDSRIVGSIKSACASIAIM